MAFSREEILTVLGDPNYNHYGAALQTIQQAVNFPVIMDYLTGKSTSLQAIVPDTYNFYWQPLPMLLENSTSIGPREQLLLDLAANVHVGPYLQYNLQNWLLRYIFENPTEKALQEVIAQFKKQGKKDDEIFSLFTFYLGFDDPEHFEIPKIPFFDFIINYIKKSKALIVPGQGSFFGQDPFNLAYFMLLDESKPQFAAEYAMIGIKAERGDVIPFLAGFKNGKYLEAIKQYADSQSTTLAGIQRKFRVAIQLYESGSVKYTNQIESLSKKFLELYLATPAEDQYSFGFSLAEFKGTELDYLASTSAAIHFLLKFNNEFALQFIDWGIENKIKVHPNTFAVLHHHKGEKAWPVIEKILDADAGQSGIDHYRVVLNFIQKSFQPSTYLPIVWQLAASKSKPIRELVAKIIAANDPEAEKKAINLLGEKNAESRITAALVLSHTASPTAKEAVLSVLNKETNDNARDLLLHIAVDSLPREADMAFITSMVDAAQKRGKLNKQVEAWLDESSLPPLYYKNGEQVPLPVTRFLLYRISRAKEMRSDPEARYVIQQLDKEKSADFGFELVSIYKNKGAKPEHKYLMLLAALLGNDSIVDKIRLSINKWIEENRIKMAEYGIGALSLQGGDKALRWVEWYSRKYKSSKAKIGQAALEALENAAEESGITTHELGDRIVPDFGFDGLFKHFTVNGDEFRAFIDSNFKIAFFNEDNKKIKTVPAAADPVLKDELKAIAKEVRDIVKSQSPRLEYYLIVQRRWSFDNWQRFFLQNPIMFIFATKLLWGVYDADGKIVQTFMCNDDTSLVDVNHEEILPDESKSIGIVHPSQLSAELLQQWKQVFFDSSIEAIFPQLDRALPDMKDIDLSKKIITKFVGKRMKQGSTRSTLEKFGWFRGPVGDGGMLESINLKYHEKKLEAVLEVEGIGVGYGWGGDDKLGRFYIIDTGTNIKQQFNSFQEDDNRLATLESVPGIFLREALAAIEAIKPLEKIT